MDRGDDEVAFVLTVVVIGHDDDFTFFKCPDGVDDALLVIGHWILPYFNRPVWPLSRR